VCAGVGDVGAQPRAGAGAATGGGAQEWAARVGWPAGLAVPALAPIPLAGVITERRRFPDRVAEIRARGTGELGPMWARWTEAVRQAGGTVEAEHVGAGEASATVCPGDCAHGKYFASVVSDSWLWWTLRAAAARPPAPPGACVAVPDDHWHICWTSGDGRTRCNASLRTRWDLDLDRDGVPDARVPQPRARDPGTTCPQDVEWDLYVTRGSCGHRVGRVRGDVSRWRAAPPTLSGGWIALATEVSPPGPWESAVHLGYAYRASSSLGYAQASETRDTARCDVHPADCEGGTSRMLCAVRDHPTVVGPFDSDAASVQMLALAESAQRSCAAQTRRPERCSVDLRVEPAGNVAGLRVRGCDAARRCVVAIYQAGSFTRFAGDAAPLGASFSIPAVVPR